MIAPALHAAYCLLCIGAAAQDVRQLRIANAWPVALTLVGLAALAAGGGDVIQKLAVFAVVLAAGMALFAAGWFGGGDTKLLAAASLAFPFATLPGFLATVAMVGGALALVSLLRPGGRQAARKRRLPYGVPIALGAIICSTAAGGIAGALPQFG